MSTPSFDLDVAELKLEELLDERSALCARLLEERNQRLQALSAQHAAEKRELTTKQTDDRMRLTRSINDEQHKIKAELELKIIAAREAIQSARKEMKKRLKLAERELLREKY